LQIFGPILPIITVRSFDEALELIKQGEKPLTAYLFTRDEEKVQQLIKRTSSGSICINDVILQLTGIISNLIRNLDKI
jgi:acyl-CoA reductase-like NAD-dependent aldehyde dehydrogenase